MLRQRTHHCAISQHILRARKRNRKTTRVSAAIWATMEQVLVHVMLRALAA
jgi:hypothetical protein